LNLQELARECHEIAKEKGFWDGVEPYSGGDLTVLQEGHVWKQIAHMLSEAWEAERVARELDYPYYDDNYLEELADIWVVLADLLTWLGWEMPLAAFYHEPPWMLIGEFADAFRKQGVGGREQMLGAAQKLTGALATQSAGYLYDAVRKKMEINRQRPRRYGVHG